ncbi:MAG: (2Fe-2S) ferredoxin protein [Bacteroidetes bacterium]|jgi:(2Fe-2S) ferredoxin|nr:(2Fe-2S) ferredoxin protein [Bacteroidota bacterium]
MENTNVYDKHIFVCTNERKPGEKRSCGLQHGTDLVEAFKKGLKEKNLPIRTRAQKTACLGICTFGPTVAVYPEGTFYVGVEVSDVNEIIDSHIAGNKPVERLLLQNALKQ